MLNLEYYFSLYLFICVLSVMCLYFKHLMCLIISLEFLMICILMNFYILMLLTESNFYLMMFLMIMFVCEGVLSLSLIILLVRLYGNDYINSLSLIKW